MQAMTQAPSRSLSQSWLAGLAEHLDPTDAAATAGDFRDFMRATSPAGWSIDARHMVYLRDRLEAVTSGACKRLMVFMPPRHGKSESMTIRYPVYRLERNPATRVVIAAYTATLAAKFSRRARGIAAQRFPLSLDRKAADDWETPAGGGVRAVGVGGGLTGHGYDLICIDDPIKSREEAESEVYRDKLWSWYTDDLYTRLEPGGAIAIAMTRWHEDDLAGRILLSEQAADWTVVSLPAIAEEEDGLGRRPGVPLWPERFDLPALEDIRATQGFHSFDALYQQHPTSKEGAFFKVNMLGFVDASPTGLPSCRAWDFAATEAGGDWTAGPKLEGPDRDGVFYVSDVCRGQWSTERRNAQVVRCANTDGVATKIRGAQDPGSAGVDAAKAFVRLLAGFSVRTARVTGSKESRADPFSAQVNAGNVRLVRAPWNAAYVNELRVFPGGKNDDQVDGSADAFNELAGKRRGRAY